MLCPRCGAANLDDAPGCANCGYRVAVDVFSDSRRSKYVGVGGWLAFFIVTQLIVGPIASFPGLLQEFHALKVGLKFATKISHGLLFVVALDFVAVVFVRAFGIYAALSLWKRSPNAVATAKRYVLSAGVYWAGVLSFTIVGTIGGSMSHTRTWQHVEHTALGLSAVVLWYAYFEVSERVAATYPQLTARS